MKDAVTGEDEVPCEADVAWGRQVRNGLIVWALFSVAVVVIAGPVWDENYEWGQMVTGQTPYPEGHPLYVFTRNAFTVLTYGSAALLKLGCGPEIVCGHRNMLFLMATVIPVFLLGAALSRRAWFGHAAAVLILAGIHLEFVGSYPQFTWPTMFSNGHIGTGYALTVLALLALRKWPAAFFMLGFMPCIHVGQMPPLMLLAGVQFLWVARERSRLGEWVRALRWGAGGAALCGTLWLAQRPFIVEGPSEGAYAAGDVFLETWRGITAFFDMHRMRPKLGGHVAACGAVLLAGRLAWDEARVRRPGVWTWVFLYCVGLYGTLLGIIAVHRGMGPDIPFILLRTMPYRLLNHMPLILVCSVLGALAGAGQRGKSQVPLIVAAVALVYVAFYPLLPHVLGDQLYARYAVPSAGLPFLLYGAAWAGQLGDREQRRKTFAVSVGVVAAACAALGTYHRFGAFCIAGGVVAVLGMTRLLERWPKSPANDTLERLGRSLKAPACVVAVVSLFLVQYQSWESLSTSPFEREVAAYLDARGDGNTMMAPYPSRWLLLAKTGHPVMTDAALPTWVSYMPCLARPVRNIYADLYGYDFETWRTEKPDTRAWMKAWPSRTRAEWGRLAREYAFGYVLAPATLRLDLPTALEGPGEVLYAVPMEP